MSKTSKTKKSSSKKKGGTLKKIIKRIKNLFIKEEKPSELSAYTIELLEKNGFGNYNNILSSAPTITFKNYVKSIGDKSANANVYQIEVNVGEHIQSAIIKSSILETSDNLLYEYLVGKFLNQYRKQFPCFLETYGITFTGRNVNNTFFKNQELSNENWTNEIITDYTDACAKPTEIKIMIENIQSSKTMYDMCRNNKEFVENHLLYILYQIYLPLSKLSTNFTHYDLHTKNVLIYEPVSGKDIHFHYHLPNGETVEFKTPYVAKIIDYGRCFFKYTKSKIDGSKEIREKICQIKECDVDNTSDENVKFNSCGQSKGFIWDVKNESHITPGINNVSQDLQLLIFINNQRYIREKYDELIKKLPNSNYAKNRFSGIKSITTDGIKDGKINNVRDAEVYLRGVVENKESRNEPIGELHIYTDGSPMRFTTN